MGLNKTTLNYFTRNKVLIKDKLLFAGGHPKFRWFPVIFRWGTNISFCWLGCELVYLRGL